MSDEPSQGAEQVRAAGVIGAPCLATDLGMGFPFEHGLQSTLAAARLADRLAVDAATASQAYYAWPASTGQGRGDPAANADRPRRRRRHVPALARRRGARGAAR